MMTFAPEYVTYVLNENFEDAKALFLSPLMAIHYGHLVMLAAQGIVSPEDAHALREALERFAVWEATHPIRLSPSAALEAIGALYELLPPSGRRRPVDPAGVMALHATLSILSR